MKIVKNQRKRLIAIAFLATLILGIFSEHLVSRAENGQALSISPPVLELSADPGQSVTASIKLTNISSGELLIKNQVNDFGAKNETGEPNIIFDDAESSTYSLKNWVVAPAPFKIASKETRVVDFKINVPQGAEPGGHYAVVRFTGQAPELEDTGVALSASLGSLVLLKVSGATQEKATITDFYSANSNKDKTSFFENAPINFVERIHNEGNVHVKPSGTVEVTDIFRRKVATLQVNGDPKDPKNPPRSVLPNSFRRFEQTLNQAWMFGPYTATAKLAYGSDNSQIITSTTSFWVIPYKLILLILLIIILLVLLVRFLNKRYKQRIIKKYAGQQQASNTKPTPTQPRTTPVPPKSHGPSRIDLRSSNNPPAHRKKPPTQ